MKQMLGWSPRHRSPLNGGLEESKEGSDRKASRGTIPVSKSPRREKDITVGTTAGVRLAAQHVALRKSNRVGHSSPQPRVPARSQHPLLRWEQPLGAPILRP
jgi:hypothetical protein